MVEPGASYRGNLSMEGLDDLHELICQVALRGTQLQQADGSMPAGHNGPHRDTETPVRNTSHWLLTFLRAYELTPSRTLRTASERALAFLSSSSARPMGAAFWHRVSRTKDACNGLIGQAWTIQALAQASAVLGDPRHAEIGRSVLNQHAFDTHRGLWRNLNVDGSHGGVNPSLNQQIWFCHAAIRIRDTLKMREDSELEQRIDRFGKMLPFHLALRPDGIFFHEIPRSSLHVAYRHLRVQLGLHSHWQEVGYHPFTLLGLSLLLPHFPDGRSQRARATFESALRAARGLAYISALENDRSAFSYNPTGFEMACILRSPAAQALGSSTADAEHWISRQLTMHYDPTTALMNRNTSDGWTLAARFCEITWLDFDYRYSL